VEGLIKKPEDISRIVELACQRREMVIIVTPYLRFSSTFMALKDGEIHIQATMSREDALYGLKSPSLKIRFPQGLSFFEAPAEMVGLGMLEGRRSVRLAMPRIIRENDQRVAYRVERVGRVIATFCTPRPNIYQASLTDISTSGARLLSQQDLSADAIQNGDHLAVAIPLSQDIHIDARAVVRHFSGRSLGVQFVPALARQIEEPLSRWVFLRQEEDRERMARRQESEFEDPRAPGAQTGVLLVSADPALEATLKGFLGPEQPLTRISPSAQILKEALIGKPPLAIFHVSATGLDDRRRLKALVEIATGKAPVLLLGTRVDGAALFELSGEWKAASAMAWEPSRGLFFQRLVQGIIRRHRGGGESPMAPQEE
jgi:hypothetical protein